MVSRAYYSNLQQPKKQPFQLSSFFSNIVLITTSSPGFKSTTVHNKHLDLATNAHI